MIFDRKENAKTPGGEQFGAAPMRPMNLLSRATVRNAEGGITGTGCG